MAFDGETVAMLMLFLFLFFVCFCYWCWGWTWKSFVWYLEFLSEVQLAMVSFIYIYIWISFHIHIYIYTGGASRAQKWFPPAAADRWLIPPSAAHAKFRQPPRFCGWFRRPPRTRNSASRRGSVADSAVRRGSVADSAVRRTREIPPAAAQEWSELTNIKWLCADVDSLAGWLIPPQHGGWLADPAAVAVWLAGWFRRSGWLAESAASTKRPTNVYIYICINAHICTIIKSWEQN